jgi:hypothetical protein
MEEGSSCPAARHSGAAAGTPQGNFANKATAATAAEDRDGV